ncbi:NACHT N-terminal Helical domain 1-containing protein [Streptomyces sp. NPDC002845]
MKPTGLGAGLVSTVVRPLIKKLFVPEGAGVGPADRPIPISSYVSFRGDKRTFTETDLRELAAELVRQALRAGGRPIPADEEGAVADALAITLHTLGDLDLTDAEAVALGHQALAARLRSASGRPERYLPRGATVLYERLVDTACLHILHLFTQRSAFVPRTLVEQSRSLAELIAEVDGSVNPD